eukprot:TRINITY_DN5024_c0_g3_i5.p1 TRINITY_DN5024_c0_g3~~TRINITY_DN5024_c0_g3_i5.p1  ORF type:complete len:116 (+),score=24.26 TRINITY_DN5024_c0_g3_i5:167-514(+)
MLPSLESLSPPLFTYEVTVTNNGGWDADDVVLGFLIPPGAGKDGVPLQTLFGFERVNVPKGESVTVFLYPSLLDFTQVNVSGERLPVAGEYTFHFGIPETQSFGQGFAVHTIRVE